MLQNLVKQGFDKCYPIFCGFPYNKYIVFQLRKQTARKGHLHFSRRGLSFANF